jgi:hypothetical protein
MKAVQSAEQVVASAEELTTSADQSAQGDRLFKPGIAKMADGLATVVGKFKV